MSAPADGAALMALALRRFPFVDTTITLRCTGCAASVTTAAGQDTTGVDLLGTASGLVHDCVAPDLTATCADHDDGWLDLTCATGEPREPDGDRRWRPGFGKRLLDLVTTRIHADPRRPIVDIDLSPLAGSGIRRSAPAASADTVHAAFHAQALRTPDTPAVIGPGTSVTYRELAGHAARVAAHLTTLPDGPVAVDLRHGPAEVAALLGILMAGRAYLALDRRSPVARLARIVALARPVALLTDDTGPGVGLPVLHVPDLLDGPAADVDRHTGAPTDPACVMFTSGSTGSPKGVVVAHESVLRLADSDILPEPDKAGRFLRSASLAFDASTFELWLPLLHGGTVVAAGVSGNDLDTLSDTLRRYSLDVVWLTTGLFHQLSDLDPAGFAGVGWVFTGGEYTRSDAVAKVLAHGARHVVHCYGPTENTTFTTTQHFQHLDELAGRTRMPIGRPVGDDLLLVLDGAGRPVPQGLAGELVVAGRGVALGYLTDDDTPHDRFAPRIRDGVRLRGYRTGDHVTELAGGTLDFLGRVDGQVKLRGFRVEFGEIETALRAVPGVRDAAACLAGSAPDESPLLGAVIVPDGEPASDLAERLRAVLPEYMVPDRVIELPSLPCTESGKLDRRALAHAVRRPDRDARRPADPVRTAVEKVLGHGPFTDEDNLLDFGLHSLRALRLLRELRDMAPSLTLRQLLGNTSIDRLRALVQEGAA